MPAIMDFSTIYIVIPMALASAVGTVAGFGTSTIMMPNLLFF